MSNPTFKPGDVCWFVRLGKITLAKNIDATGKYPLTLARELVTFTDEGKEFTTDPHRVLYTMEEARQYGWLPKEPLRMAVHAEVLPCGDGSINGRVGISLNELQPLVGKKVRLTIEEIP